MNLHARAHCVKGDQRTKHECRTSGTDVQELPVERVVSP